MNGGSVGPDRLGVAGGVALGHDLAGVDVVDEVRAADEDVDGAVGAGQDGRRDDRAQLLEQLLALVEEVVGVVAGDLDALDLAVQARDLRWRGR